MAFVCGENFLYGNLIQCIQTPSHNLLERFEKLTLCSNNSFFHCIVDTNSYNNKSTVLQSICGYITSINIKAHKQYTWQITTRQTVWLHILHFKLYSYHLACSLEYIVLKDTDKDQVLCGNRLPWKHYSVSSTVLLDFVIDIGLHHHGIFESYFQEGKRIRKEYIQVDVRSPEKIINHISQKSFKHKYLHFLAERLYAIELKIYNCSLISYSVYDGPGVDSPPLKKHCKFMSTSFVMLLLIYGPHMQLTFYGINYNTIQQPHIKHCFTKETTNDEEMKLHVSDMIGNKCCMWTPSAFKPNRFYVNSFHFEGPDTLLEGEECIYGGLFIYMMHENERKVMVWSSCRRDSLLQSMPIIIKYKSSIIVVATVFHKYSMIRDFVGRANITRAPYYVTYPNSALLNSRQHLQLDLDEGLSSDYEYEIYAQSILQQSALSTVITFGPLTSIAARVKLKSTMCAIPPYFCSCITLDVRYLNPISFYKNETNRENESIFPHELTFLSPVSSLIVNQSLCINEQRTVWMLDLEVRFHMDILANRSLPFMINLSTLFELTLNVSGVTDSTWWLLLHLQEAPEFRSSKILNSIHISTDMCTPTQSVEVEYLMSDGQAVVYDVNDIGNPLISDYQIEILCDPCNLIIHYNPSLLTETCKNADMKVCIDITKEKSLPFDNRQAVMTDFGQRETWHVAER